MAQENYSPAEAPAYRTMKEFAEAYDVCLATVYNWASWGWLPTIKIGRLRRVTPEGEAKFRERAERGEFVLAPKS